MSYLVDSLNASINISIKPGKANISSRADTAFKIKLISETHHFIFDDIFNLTFKPEWYYYSEYKKKRGTNLNTNGYTPK